MAERDDSFGAHAVLPADYECGASRLGYRSRARRTTFRALRQSEGRQIMCVFKLHHAPRLPGNQPEDGGHLDGRPEPARMTTPAQIAPLCAAREGGPALLARILFAMQRCPHSC